MRKGTEDLKQIHDMNCSPLYSPLSSSVQVFSWDCLVGWVWLVRDVSSLSLLYLVFSEKLRGRISVHLCDQQVVHCFSWAAFYLVITGKGGEALLQLRSLEGTSEAEVLFWLAPLLLKSTYEKHGHNDYYLKSLLFGKTKLSTLGTKTFSYLELADHSELIRFAFLFKYTPCMKSLMFVLFISWWEVFICI